MENGVAASASGRIRATKSVDGNFMIDIFTGVDEWYDRWRDGERR